MFLSLFAHDRYDEEITEAFNKGITGVPFFELSLPDHPQKPSQSLSGAQPVDTFIHVFKRLQSLSKM